MTFFFCTSLGCIQVVIIYKEKRKEGGSKLSAGYLKNISKRVSLAGSSFHSVCNAN